MSTGKLAKRYNPLRVLGEGAMGRVWLALDTVKGREVAMKVLSERTADADGSTLRIKQEFRLMTQLRHPNCCAVYDYGVLPDGEPYFTMEVVEGHGLDELLPLPPERVRPILIQLLAALGYVHQLGLVHRDIKSANVRVTPDGTVKLMDFGLMEHAGRAGGPITGTVAYIAPEVVKRGAVDQRTDLYAVGALAYELLTGRPPFVAERPLEVLRAHAEQRPEPPSRLVAGLSAEWEQLVLKLLAKDPLDRYQSAAEVRAAHGVEAEMAARQLLASPMIAREAALSELDARLAEVASQRPGGALALTGPLGVGKSRLVEEFRFHAQLAHLPCAVARNHEFSRTPYGPLVAVLRSLMPDLKAHAREVLARHAAVLVKVLPELAAPPAEALDPPSKEKLRLHEAVAELFAALAAAKGLVVVLEDWQWADPLSVELLGYLLKSLAGQPVLAVLTMREWPEADPWHGRIAPLALEALSPESQARMVAAMLGTAAIAPTFLQQVNELTEGNPYHIEMLLDHMVTTGVLTQADGAWKTDVDVTADGLPQDLRGFLIGKIDRLSSTAQRVAKVAAAAGYNFDLALLASVAGLADEGLFAAIEALLSQQVFIEKEPGLYQFSQDQLQDVLYNGLTAEERQALHTAIASALVARLGGAPLAEAPLETLTLAADQAMRGQLAELCVAFCLETGSRHARLLAYHEALAYLEPGLARVRHAAAGRFEAERLAYLRELGDVYRVIGRYEQARVAYTEAIPLGEALGAGQVLGRMWTSLAKTHQVLNQFPEALVACDRALDIAGQFGDHGETARSLMTSARIHYFAGALPLALDHAERALLAARASGDAGKIGAALGFLGYLSVTAVPERMEAGLADLVEAVRLHHELGDKIGLSGVLDYLGNAQQMRGDYREARDTFQTKRQLAAEVGYREEEVIALVNLANAALELGAHGEARALAAEGATIARGLNAQYPLGMALILEAVAASRQGELATAFALAAEAQGVVARLKHRYLEAHVLLYVVEIAVTAGRLDEADARSLALSALVEAIGLAEVARRHAPWRAEIARRRGEAEAARAIAEAALAEARTAKARGLVAQCLLTLAPIHLEAGEWELARGAANEALAIARLLGAAMREAQAHGLLGELAFATGQGEARAHYEAMLAQAAGTPLLAAEAAFGLAAAAPYAPEAREWAAKAKGGLAGLTVGLDAEAAAAFNAYSERRRVLEGNYVGFSLPLDRSDKTRPPLARPGWEL